MKKYYEYDSVDEINREAAELRQSGKMDELQALAKEIGIDEEDAGEYVKENLPELVTPLMAAMGKLKREAEELKLKGIVADWKDVVIQMCSEDKTLPAAVMKKDKKLVELLGQALKVGFEAKVRLDDRIVRAAKLNPPIYLGLPNRSELMGLAQKYYQGRTK